MTVEHSTITDPEIHEPKGVSTATTGQTYISNGAGSGSWVKPFKYVDVYTAYSTGSPYVHAISTSDTVLNPTVNTGNISQFTVQTSPNFRLRYDGVETCKGVANLSLSFRQSDGADRAVQWVLYKNGSAIPGARIIVTTVSAHWTNVTVICGVTLNTNDYVEVFAQSGASFDSDYAKIHLSIEGHIV